MLLRAFLFATTLLIPSLCAAQVVGLPVHQVGGLRVDGRVRDWRDVRFAAVGEGEDAFMRYALGIDDDALYVGATVRDERMIRTAHPTQNEDAIVLTLAFPARNGRYRAVELWLFAGVAGTTAGSAASTSIGGRPRAIRGATVVEGPNDRGAGYILEAKIPLSAIEGIEAISRGRGAIRLHDVDSEARPEAEHEPASATVDARALESMPELLLDNAEAVALRGFLEEHDLSAATPRVDAMADVAGDERDERVLVIDRYVLVMGPGYRNGEGYGFHELAVARGGDVESAELRDLTGDRHPELVVTMTQRNDRGARRLFSVVDLGREPIRPVFAIETRKEVGSAHIEAALEVRNARRGAPSIVVRIGSAEGLDASSYRESPARDAQPILTPWGETLSRTYAWNGSEFAMTSERPNPDAARATTPTRPTRPQVAATPTQSAAPDARAMVAAIRREHGIASSVRSRFEADANVAEDTRPEHLLVLGKAIVVFGTGFRGGQGYFLSELAVASEDDILGVETADLSGDGRAEILVRVRQNLGEVAREILLVHRFTRSGFPRAAQIEVARSSGRNRVENEVRVSDDGLEIRPGRARGWSASSWPYADGTSDGIDPLLLPWRDRAVRYRFNHDRLERS